VSISGGGHGAWPESTVDPVVMAASAMVRLQTIVSREVAAFEPVVVTIGSLQAGTNGNVIPDDAVLKINVRTFDNTVRTRVLAAIERIVKSEAAAAGAPRPPELTYFDHFDLTVNDPPAANHVGECFRGYFGTDRPRHRAHRPAAGQRGLRAVRSGVEGSIRLLVRRWHRSRPLPARRAGGADRRGCADQPQLQVRARPAPHARNRDRGSHVRDAQLPRAVIRPPHAAADGVHRGRTLRKPSWPAVVRPPNPTLARCAHCSSLIASGSAGR
jgi:hypothetical protein